MIWSLNMWAKCTDGTEPWNSTSWKDRSCWSCVSPQRDVQLCLCAGLPWRCLESWTLYPDTMWVPTQASGRGRDFWRGGAPGGHFPLQNLHREAQGVTTPCMEMWGTLYTRAWRSGRHMGQGVKKSVSNKSGRLDRDRDVWNRLQAEGSVVKFEKALSQVRQVCLQAGALF